MPAVATAAHKKGDFFVDYEEKVFEDVKAQPGSRSGEYLSIGGTWRFNR
jgi:hypothetical protein